MAEPLVIEAYGRRWEYPKEFGFEMAVLDIEFSCFRERYSVESGALGAAEHFKNIARVLAPEFVWLSDYPEIPYHSQWTDRILDALVAYDYVGITGPASAAKSEVCALWVLISWMARFDRTLVLITSTDKGGAKKRIWSAIKERYQKICALGFKVGRYVENPQTMIAANDGSPETKHLSDRSSISLVAVDQGKGGQSYEKLLGFKNEFVILLSDEMTGMSQAVMNSTANLSKNPNFQFIGLGNADMRTDSHGKFCEPMEGWNSVDVNEPGWKTKRGYCVHLDGETSPNLYTDPVDKFPFLITSKGVEEDKLNYGENSRDYWRMDRGFWAPQGVDEGIYSELEIAAAGADQKVTWREQPIKLAFLDPAFKFGGDSFLMSVGSLGFNNRGVRVFELSEQIKLIEDVQSESSVNKQVSSQFVTLCRDRGITTRHMGMDCSGGGSLMADYVEDLLREKGILRIEFGASPSDLVVEVQGNEQIRAKDRYADAMTELWHSGLQYIRSQQLYGLNSTVITQMVKRSFLRTGSKKLKAEPKRDYKKRIGGKSPDEADSFFGCLHLARVRFGFATMAGKNLKKTGGTSFDALRAMHEPVENTEATRFSYGD